MDIAADSLSSAESYKVLGSLVVPRPIAFVSTQSPEGGLNCAPFSFFNAIAHSPPMLVLGIEQFEDGREKDTGHNIRRTGEFVVNMVDEALAEKMNLAAIDFPSEIDEFEEVGLTPVSSSKIKVPGIAESPVRFECVRSALVQVGSRHTIAIGEVVSFHIRDDLIDREKLRISESWRPLGRMFGADYARITETFAMPRVPLSDWEKNSDK